MASDNGLESDSKNLETGKARVNGSKAYVANVISILVSQYRRVRLLESTSKSHQSLPNFARE